MIEPAGLAVEGVSGGPAPLAVRRLVLTEFRNYRRLKLTAEARPIVLTGPNGAGKTNLLEALSYLAPGRGLRRARLAEVARRAPEAASSEAVGDVAWAVSATLAGPQGPVEIGTGREPLRAGDGQGAGPGVAAGTLRGAGAGAGNAAGFGSSDRSPPARRIMARAKRICVSARRRVKRDRNGVSAAMPCAVGQAPASWADAPLPTNPGASPGCVTEASA